jgi:hypothetical protein
MVLAVYFRIWFKCSRFFIVAGSWLFVASERAPGTWMVCRSTSYKYGPLPLVTQTGVVSYHKLGRILDSRYEMSIVGKSTINVNDETASITPPFSQRTRKIMIDRVCFKFDISRAHHFRRRAFARPLCLAFCNSLQPDERWSTSSSTAFYHQRVSYFTETQTSNLISTALSPTPTEYSITLQPDRFATPSHHRQIQASGLKRQNVHFIKVQITDWLSFRSINVRVCVASR